MVNKSYYTVCENGKVTYCDDVENVRFEIPESDFAGLILGKKMPAIDGNQRCIEAIDHPICCDCLEELVKKKQAKTVSILVSDGTRGVPTKVASTIIVEKLVSAGIKPQDILFVVGTGLHRAATEAEYRSLVSEEYYGKVEMISNDAFDPSTHIALGKTARGLELEVNRRAYECDLHISIGKAAFHGMAGFSGGRKSVFPGICSYKTISGNHTPQMISDPNTKRGVLEGNPFHEEMLEAARMYNIDFCVTFVMNDENQIAQVFAGELNESHVAACNFIREYADIKLPERADIYVVTTGEPFNVNFYQASRAMRMLDRCIDESTVVAFYAACPEGVMADEMLMPFDNSQSLAEAEKWMWENWDPRMDDTMFHIKTLKTGAKFICYSPGVDRSVFEKMYCHGADSFEDFLTQAYKLSGKDCPRVTFFPMLHNYAISIDE